MSFESFSYTDEKVFGHDPITEKLQYDVCIIPRAIKELTMKSDSEIQENVLKQLKWDPSLNSDHIGVRVANGVVTLTGYVSSYSEKWAAEKAVEHVAGVKAIADELEVKLPDSSRRDDVEIARTAADALKSNISVPDDVKAIVEHGWITLKGEVEWGYQKEAAENAVRNLFGVKGVINNIAVRPKVAPTDVKNKIKDALERIAIEEANKIAVDVDGSKVILKGKVHSWDEYWAARNAAWSAPGVTTVETKDLEIAA